MSGLSISTAPLPSPTSVFSGPPPYPYAPSTGTSISAQSGHVSPPRPPARDDKDPPSARQSLPSISEALGKDSSMAFPTPVASQAATFAPQPLSAPASAVGHSFPEGPAGPSNPFSPAAASTGVPPPRRDRGSRPDLETGSPFASLNTTEPRPPPPVSLGAPRSPRFAATAPFAGGANHTAGPYTDPPLSPRSFPPYRSPFAFAPSASNPPPPPPLPPATSHPDPFRAGGQGDEPRKFAPRGGPSQPYGESVKRPLEAFDAPMTFHEVGPPPFPLPRPGSVVSPG